MTLSTRLLDLLFPPQCLICNQMVATHGTLCLECWQKMQFLTDPLCERCGYPFDHVMDDNALCGSCMRELPSFRMARAVFRYDEHSRALVLKLKYADQTQLASVYGNWLAKAGKELLVQSDVIVPVPLHYWRFLTRRYNQSALLARAVSKYSTVRWLPDALKRIRPTATQTGLTRSERQKNVSGAFGVSPRYLHDIKGKTVLLVDDVMTTAATIEQCARCLLKAGALNVHVLTLARTVE